ncbi:NADPH:quinone oxidoreductase family protein [Agrobacterium fabrum]|uniref:NADPH:quinone oxidoreductase family protein n=1 Tax=Agrobacterium fabrum TaxID=1176649 RepID=UPI0015744A2B|nr:NADPH:quinone oxidoreductase family protein [Agrobacterium fabrum]WCK80159.1 NADPH:quinone oxidoreductase family protein [Agrobacterium fabrum]
MRRFATTELGSPENFAFEEVPDPLPGAGQVRIKVHAVALGFVDGLIAAGKYQMMPTLPFTPGGEIAGVVDMVGPDVHELRPGARVVSWQLGGGLADYVVVSAIEADVIPDKLGFAAAAAMLVDYQTARYALLERGKLKADETVLIAGAAGGVGSAAIQIASKNGAHVIALISDPARYERAIKLGASSVLSPSAPHLRSELRLLAPNGINLAVDPVGGTLSEQMFRSLAKEGRHLVIGFADGTIPAIPSNLALVKSTSLIGVDLRHLLAAYPDAARRSRHELFENVVGGELTPPITTTYQFEQARDALATTRSRSGNGKPVVLVHEK